MNYEKRIKSNSTIRRYETYEGETIEQKVRRVMENNEPIKDGAAVIYNERKEGVLS